MHLIEQIVLFETMYVTLKKSKKDESVVLQNVVVEIDSQVFKVVNLEESDVALKDAQVDVCDVLDHDDVRITEFVVNDSIVAGSHLTKNVIRELSPIAADQEAIAKAHHGNVDSLSGRVGYRHSSSIDRINFRFHTKDSTISVKIAYLNFRALIDTGAAVTEVSARVWQRYASNIRLKLGPPNHD